MKKKKKHFITFFIILIISICGILLSIKNIIKWNNDNIKTSNEINDLNTIIKENESNNNYEIINPKEENKNNPYWYYITLNMINVDLKELKKINNDTKGWIQVKGTNVNYPFVQYKDNEYYLNKSFNKKDTDAGWIFLDYRNDINNLSKNNIIYGHARLDKSMFGTLKNTLTKDWYNNIDNHIIKLSTEKENTLWQIFSIYHQRTENYYITTYFKNDNEFQKYINTSLEKSIYKFNTIVTTNDTLLTLSTCYKSNQKLIIQAKLIKRETR